MQIYQFSIKRFHVQTSVHAACPCIFSDVPGIRFHPICSVCLSSLHWSVGFYPGSISTPNPKPYSFVKQDEFFLNNPSGFIIRVSVLYFGSTFDQRLNVLFILIPDCTFLSRFCLGSHLLCLVFLVWCTNSDILSVSLSLSRLFSNF